MAGTSDDTNLIGLKLGNYRLERLLGRGRMGVVYLARDEALLRRTAVKIMAWAFTEPHGQDPEAWLLAEARNVARINHPSVIQVHSVARHGAYCYIAMEYVEGVSADTLVAQNGPFSPMQATEVILQVAGALHVAHQCQVIHRDIKPANVLVKADRTVKLGDFGMAMHPATMSSMVGAERAGTPHYTAPEIWRGEPASPASDIYALGATYYFLLTGRPPFEAKDLPSMIAAHLHTEMPDPREENPGIPAECVEIARRCLAKLPKDRYASAQAVSWEARGLLRKMSPSNASSGAAHRSDLPARGVKPAPRPPFSEEADKPRMAFLGLVRRPFVEPDPSFESEFGAPFSGRFQEVRAHLDAHHGSTILLVGPAGSGRRTLARRLAAHPVQSETIARLEGEDWAAAGSLVLRACRALGAVPNPYGGPTGEIEGLLDHLQASHAACPAPALLILEGLGATPNWASDLNALMTAAASTGYFSLVITGGNDLADRLTRSGVTLRAPPAVLSVPMGPLSYGETAQYIRAWLKLTRDPAAPVVLMTPDATLLIALRSEGNLGRINRLATNTLRIAADRQRRLVSSWEAWAAAESDRELLRPEFRERASLDPPPDWPTPDVVELLNACREKAGLAERKGDDREAK